MNRYNELSHVQQCELDKLINSMASFQSGPKRIARNVRRVSEAIAGIRADTISELSKYYDNHPEIL